MTRLNPESLAKAPAEPVSGNPSLRDGPGGQSDAQRSLELRSEGVRRRKDEGGKDQIKDPDPEIAEPPPQRRELPLPPRPAKFPGPDKDQAAYQYDEAQLIAPCSATGTSRRGLCQKLIPVANQARRQASL